MVGEPSHVKQLSQNQVCNIGLELKSGLLLIPINRCSNILKVLSSEMDRAEIRLI
jgi:hypothetical protein